MTHDFDAEEYCVYGTDVFPKECALPNFLSADERQFCATMQYEADKKYDRNVEPYRGSSLPESCRTLLAAHFAQCEIDDAAVYLYFFDNSDVAGCPRTYKVEIGLPHSSAFGVFGSSGSACTDINSAFLQATINFVMKVVVKPQSNMVAHRQRV